MFRALLGPGLLYSSGLWESLCGSVLSTSVLGAETASIDQMLGLAGLDSRERRRVLDLGCGWGAVTKELALRGHSVDALTVSERQAKYVRDELQTLGTHDVTVHVAGFRSFMPSLPYEVILCIEMAESVSALDYKKLTSWVAANLVPEGRAVFQFSGVRNRSSYSRGRRPTHVTDSVFKGSTLVARDQFVAALVDAGLAIKAEYDLAPDYVLTLEGWKENWLRTKPGELVSQAEWRSMLHFLDLALGFYRSGHGGCWRIVTCHRKVHSRARYLGPADD